MSATGRSTRARWRAGPCASLRMPASRPRSASHPADRGRSGVAEQKPVVVDAGAVDHVALSMNDPAGRVDDDERRREAGPETDRPGHLDPPPFGAVIEPGHLRVGRVAMQY